MPFLVQDGGGAVYRIALAQQPSMAMVALRATEMILPPKSRPIPLLRSTSAPGTEQVSWYNQVTP